MVQFLAAVQQVARPLAHCCSYANCWAAVTTTIVAVTAAAVANGGRSCEDLRWNTQCSQDVMCHHPRANFAFCVCPVANVLQLRSIPATRPPIFLRLLLPLPQFLRVVDAKAAWVLPHLLLRSGPLQPMRQYVVLFLLSSVTGDLFSFRSRRTNTSSGFEAPAFASSMYPFLIFAFAHTEQYSLAGIHKSCQPSEKTSNRKARADHTDRYQSCLATGEQQGFPQTPSAPVPLRSPLPDVLLLLRGRQADVLDLTIAASWRLPSGLSEPTFAGSRRLPLARIYPRNTEWSLFHRSLNFSSPESES